MSQALFEDIFFDDEGMIINTDFYNYITARTTENPYEQTPLFVEIKGKGTGPYGMKELGMSLLWSPAPSIINAVYDAIGVPFKEWPVTPEKILEAIGKSKGGE